MLLSTLFLFIEQPKTIIFIVLILVLFFGAKRIPELMRGLGQGVREFKDASTDANKAPQTHQPYQPTQQPYNGQPVPPTNGQQPYTGQPTQPNAYPPQQYPNAAQPNQPAPATRYDANGQPIA
jgi:sec-independent protein translocase protein TatA